MAALGHQGRTGSGLRAPVLVGLGGLAAAALLRLRDPHEDGSYGVCPFLQLTGRPCPGCGGLRAVNDLTHGDVVSAISSNLLAVLLAVSLAVAWIIWLVRRVRGVPGFPVTLGPRIAWGVVAVIAIFSVVRLTPPGSWLAP